MDPELIADYRCHTGESAIWHEGDQAVYWIDIPNGQLFRYTPESDEHEMCYEGSDLRAITIEADGSLLLFEERGTLLNWTENRTEPISIECPLDDYRFNDVIAEPSGDVLCGIMPEDDRPGALYRLHQDRTMEPILDEVQFPNGLGFSPELDRLYFTDSFANTIYSFDYDPELGALSNKQVLIETQNDRGVPDGLTVDTSGQLWSARWNGNRLVRYSSSGNHLDSISFPAKKVTSAAFGGPELTSLYVTTALGSSGDPPGTRDAEGDGAGGFYRIETEYRGQSPYRSRMA